MQIRTTREISESVPPKIPLKPARFTVPHSGHLAEGFEVQHAGQERAHDSGSCDGSGPEREDGRRGRPGPSVPHGQPGNVKAR
jgi:hypothetical protein